MKTITRSKNTLSLPLLIVAITLFTIGLSSCSKDGAVDTQTSFLLVTNAAQNSTAQDFYSDSSKVSSSLAYGSSTDFFPTAAGSHLGRFKNAGTATVNASSNMVLAYGQSYGVFYVDGGSCVVFQDDRSAPQAGKARVRFINLSTALLSNVDFVATGGAALTTNLAFKSASAYSDIDPATAININSTGTTTTLLNVPSTFQAGRTYTIYISGATTASVTAHIITEH